MDESTRGTLFGVSVGPGDPELMTLKAVRIVRTADVVAVPDTGRGPGTAYHIAREYIADKELLACATPMTRDPAATAAAHRKAADAICAFLDSGKDVAYLCLGDVSVYSSYHYVHRLVVERGYDAQIVPGVTSFCAAAARAGVPLCMGDERLLVAPLAGASVDELLDVDANKALLKPGDKIAHLRASLESRNALDQAVLVEHCGMEDERVAPHLERADDAGYLSVVLVGSSAVPLSGEGNVR